MSKHRAQYICIPLFLLAILISNLFLLASVEYNNSFFYYCKSEKEFTEAPLILKVDSLNIAFGNNKILINKYKIQSLIALSFYPELKDVEINFKYSKEATTMACRPNLISLLKGKRAYDIFINNDINFEGILLDDVPFNAQIGVIGHEVAHIVDYEGRNILGIIQVGLNYLNDNRKRTYENRIDRMTIQRGLGWQLKDWAQYSMFDSPKASEDYKAFKRKIYLNPQQIIEEMQIFSCYFMK